MREHLIFWKCVYHEISGSPVNGPSNQANEMGIWIGNTGIELGQIGIYWDTIRLQWGYVNGDVAKTLWNLMIYDCYLDTGDWKDLGAPHFPTNLFGRPVSASQEAPHRCPFGFNEADPLVKSSGKAHLQVSARQLIRHPIECTYICHKPNVSMIWISLSLSLSPSPAGLDLLR